jgi:hypothetical protein
MAHCTRVFESKPANVVKISFELSDGTTKTINTPDIKEVSVIFVESTAPISGNPTYKITQGKDSVTLKFECDNERDVLMHLLYPGLID